MATNSLESTETGHMICLTINHNNTATILNGTILLQVSKTLHGTNDSEKIHQEGNIIKIK